VINLWLFVTVLLMGLNWLAVWYEWRLVNWLSKPSIMLALLTWLVSLNAENVSIIWFAFGLLASAVGDALLLFQKYFLFGVAAFFITHIAYSIGFYTPMPKLITEVYILGLLFIAVWGLIYSFIHRGMAISPSYRRMRLPVALYGAAACGMVFMAVLTFFRDTWTLLPAALVSCGAVFFLFSDVLLGVERFICSLLAARLWKRVAYHLGQLSLIVGVAVHFYR